MPANETDSDIMTKKQLRHFICRGVYFRYTRAKAYWRRFVPLQRN